MSKSRKQVTRRIKTVSLLGLVFEVCIVAIILLSISLFSRSCSQVFSDEEFSLKPAHRTSHQR